MYIPAASRLRDNKWLTETCPLGWAVQGVWPAENDGTNVLAVDVNLTNETGDYVVASADSFGNVRMR
eukprot:1176194-Prorocentrum_lima.AAC.1